MQFQLRLWTGKKTEPQIGHRNDTYMVILFNQLAIIMSKHVCFPCFPNEFPFHIQFLSVSMLFFIAIFSYSTIRYTFEKIARMRSTIITGLNRIRYTSKLIENVDYSQLVNSKKKNGYSCLVINMRFIEMNHNIFNDNFK